MRRLWPRRFHRLSAGVDLPHRTDPLQNSGPPFCQYQEKYKHSCCPENAIDDGIRSSARFSNDLKHCQNPSYIHKDREGQSQIAEPERTAIGDDNVQGEGEERDHVHSNIQPRKEFDDSLYQSLLLQTVLNVVQHLSHQVQSILSTHIVWVHRVGEEIHLDTGVYEGFHQAEVVLHDHDIVHGSVDE